MTARRLFAAALAVALGFAPTPAFARPAAATAPARKPVLHLLVVADTRDAKIGVKVGEDAERMEKTFAAAFEAAGKGKQLNVRVLTGRDVTAARVLAAVREFDVAPADTVAVFVSGHGAIDADNRHLFQMAAGNALPRADLLAAVAVARPRLTVVLTDVCSSYLGKRAAVATAPTGEAADLPAGDVIPWATVEDLFFGHTGVVDVTAAEPGFPAAVEHRKAGSYFTNALVETLAAPRPAVVRGLDRNADRAVQWAELLPQVRASAAERQVGTVARDYTPPARLQHATARSLGTWTGPVR